jgi:hypothetical protein
VADRIELGEVTVPAGTLSSAPQTSALTFQDGDVEQVEILVPPGPAGLVGFQLWYSGQRIIPFKNNLFFRADSETIKWPLSNYPTTGRWQFVAYNLDIYDHIIQLRFLINEIRRPAPVAPPPVLVAPGGTAENEPEPVEETIGEEVPEEGPTAEAETLT